jgi:hypothetical protein
MARILVNGDWYEQVAPTAFYESEFEAVLLNQAPTLYPEFFSTEFKTLVTNEQGDSAKADLALIDRQYREWWVVEVEMGHHSLDGHVLPQVRTLATGVYGRAHAEYLAARSKQLDVESVHTLMKGRQPRVLVVVNTPKPEWVDALARYDALLAVFELFRSSLDKHVYRVNGQHPSSSPDVVSDFYCDLLLPNFAVVAAPAALGVPPKGSVTIRFGSGVTDWERVDAQDKVWLASRGPMPLQRNERYEIVRQDGELVVRTKQKTSRKPQ